MASSSSIRGGGFRYGLSMRVNRLRQKFKRPPDEACPRPPERLDVDPKSGDGLQPSSQPNDGADEIIATGEDNAHVLPNQTDLPAHRPERNSTLDHDSDSIPASSDLWSVAYCEAVKSFGKDVHVDILEAHNIAVLFTKLENTNEDKTHGSIFLRGVARLRSMQVPLETLRLGLDLTSPLSGIDPMTSTVFGVVRSVTAIAISFATADERFAEQIGEMLKRLAYIDDCDILGRKSNKKGIHEALVSVYKKVLEFYFAAHEIISKKATHFITKLVLENNRLSNIVQDVLNQVDVLQALINNATLEITTDIERTIYDAQITRLLNGSRLRLQSRYHAQIRALRSDEACKFLLAHPDFTKWYQASISSHLVILGEMGCGKTTAMAFLVDELNRRSEHILPRPKVCYHYCRNDETGTADYIYSVLILSLLQQLPGLKRTFSEWYKNNLKSGTLEPATSTRKLEEFLQEVLGTLDRLLYIVIDGLDECDKQSRRTLLRLLSNLSNSTPRLKILLSSRPEEEILGQLDKSTKIDMESTVFRDAMIVRHMIEERFPDCWTSEIKDLVTNELSRSAHGSSIWTKMIVEFMEIRDYQAIEPIRKFLRNMPLPDKLTNLYRTLISQKSSDDLENQELINMALKVLAISCRSISIQELAWAVALAAALDQVKTVADLAKLVDYGRLMALIAPFITRVDFKDTRKRQVQLVHKSVKEYVILEATTSSTPDESITYDVEILQPFILNICISYLLLDEIGSSPLSSNEQPAMGGLPQGPDLRSGGKPPKEYDPSGTRETSEKDMICYDPTASGFGEFFAYASCHWLVHFSCIESGPPPCLAKIEKLCQAGSTRLHKWTSQDCRPGRKVSGRFHLDSGSHDPLSITSLFGSDALLHKMLKKPTFDEDNYRPSSAINAVDQILQSGDLSKLGIFFLHGKLGHQLRDIEFFRNIIRRWDFAVTPRDNGKAVYELLDHVLDTIVGKHWGGALLCTAASCGCLPIIQHLFNRAQHREELRNDLLCFEAIGEAVPRDDIAVVCYLLNQEGFKASLPYVRNLAGETLLHMASKICDPEMFDLLIPRLKDIIHLVDNDGYTALVRMFRSQTDITWRRRCALILLEHASDSGNNYIGDGKHEPLQEAVKTGNVMMCRALLESEFKFDPFSALKRGNDGQWVLNAEPRVNGDDGQWVLYAEPRANGNELLEMLLEYAIPTSSS